MKFWNFLKALVYVLPIIFLGTSYLLMMGDYCDEL
jgi:hypothetical protein